MANCSSCDEKIGWRDTKIKKEEIHKTLFKKFPTLTIMKLKEEEAICKKCFEADIRKHLPSTVWKYTDKLISRKEYIKMNNVQLTEFREQIIEFGEETACYWCKKIFEKINTLSLAILGLGSDNECRECNTITKFITNSKIKELEEELFPHLSKKAMIDKMVFNSKREVMQREINDAQDSLNWEHHVYGSRVDITKMKINAQNRTEDLELQQNEVSRKIYEINLKINEEKITAIHRHFSDEKEIETKAENEGESLKILKTRLAKGDITKEEYEELKGIIEE